MYTNAPWPQKQYEETFSDLLEDARSRLRDRTDLEGIMALHTLSGNTYWTDITGNAVIGDYLEDEAAIQALIEHHDTAVACILNLYRNRTHPEEPSQPMVTSWYFSKRLTEIDPKNRDAMILLWGGGEKYGYKPLWVTMPPEKKEDNAANKPVEKRWI